MWNDKDTAIDFLDYEYLVQAISLVIRNDDLIPCTIGIFGDWGSGKSSLMKMVEANLQAEEDYLIVKFNGWQFEGYEDARSVLMATILEDVAKRMRTLPKLKEGSKKLILRLIKRINWMKVASVAGKLGIAAYSGTLPGMSPLSEIGALNSILAENPEELLRETKDENDDQNVRIGIREFHEDFGKLLELSNIKRLVVFIDDLDRCRPDTIIDTLEAIKLFLYAKDSAFVLAADERIIKLAVKDRFKEIGGNASIENDYLEKLIQFPMRIPQLNGNEVETYINLLFTKLILGKEKEKEFDSLRKNVLSRRRLDFFSLPFDQSIAKEILEHVPQELNEALSLSKIITPILSEGLKGNPRQAKRFLNTLLIRISMAKSLDISLSKRILAKLMLLEYFRIETFRRLLEIQNSRVKALSELEEFVTKNKIIDADEFKHEDLRILLKDDMFFEWLSLKPQLGAEDLRPYFYFSRDQVIGTKASEGNLTSLGRSILQRLLSSSQTIHKKALEDSKQLSNSDATQIYSILKEDFDELEKPKARKEKFKILSRFVDTRKELLNQLIQYMRGYNVNDVFAEYAIQLWQIGKEGKYQTEVKSLLENWSVDQETNKVLAKAITKLFNKN